MRVLVLNGPNLGSLGSRQPDVYGTTTLAEIEESLRHLAGELDVDLRCEQSNSEGTLIDLIEEENGLSAALIINPGALAHTSVALADAARAFAGTVIEVHLSNIFAREEYRRVSHLAATADAVIAGAGAGGYLLALHAAAQMARGTTTTTRTAS